MFDIDAKIDLSIESICQSTDADLWFSNYV